MPRATNNPASRARRKKIMLAARGFFGARSKVYPVAQAIGISIADVKTRPRKSTGKCDGGLWIARINAATRAEGVNYSRFIHALGQKGIGLNRKVLADLALHHPTAFKAVLDAAFAKG